MTSGGRPAGPRDAEVLIPTYSRPRLLERAIRSALAQAGVPVRVIVGDDGTQGAAVVERIGDHRVSYVANPARLGIAGNWNALLDRSRADAVALLMDDDVLAPDFLSTCVERLREHADVGVVFTNHLFDEGERTRPRTCDVAEGRHDDFLVTFLRHRPVAVSAALMRREVWRDVRPLPDTAAADMVLFARAAAAGWPFFYVDRPLMTYRSHGDMFSSTLGFRNDVVAAWRSMSFERPEAEALRRRLLGDALLSRASMRLRERDRQGAAADVREARSLGTSAPRQALALTVATRSALLGSIAVALAARSRRRLW